MAEEQGKIKEFFEEKRAELSNQIEKTPMEKFFVFFLILITISAFGLGYLQFKKNIESPLYSSYLREQRGLVQEKYSVPSDASLSQEQKITDLQNQDSDLDGLSDYSEIYVYKTSPYLEDTDSDGKWDKDEVVAGTDPNCPEGENCQIEFEEAANGNGQQSATSNTINQNQGLQVNPNILDYDLAELEKQLLSGEITLEELGINDPSLQQILDQLKASQEQQIEELSSEEKQSAIESIKNLTPEQIRQELEKIGVDKAMLEQIDDETLRALFEETINLYQ